MYYCQKEGVIVRPVKKPIVFSTNLPVDLSLHTGEFDGASEETAPTREETVQAYADLPYDFVWETMTEQGAIDMAKNWFKEALDHPNVAKNEGVVRYLMDAIAKAEFGKAKKYTVEEQVVYTYGFELDDKKVPLALHILENEPSFKRNELTELNLNKSEDEPCALLAFCPDKDLTKAKVLIQVDKKQVEAVKNYFSPKGQLEQVEATFAEKPTLTATEIGEVRELIKLVEDKEKKKELYRELQKKVAYRNQRDNINNDADYMCNLTSQAMCFEYLGISNPDPSIQFEDYLEKIRLDNDFEEREYASAREAIASKFNVNQKVKLNPSMTRQYLKSLLEPKINKGYGIMISVGGHLVRLEQVKNNGLIVDDPFGKVDLVKRYKNGNDSYGDQKNSSSGATIKGEDNLWEWKDIEKVKFKYIEWYYL